MRFPSSKYTKIRCGWGFAPDPTAGANYSAPRSPLMGMGLITTLPLKLYPRSRPCGPPVFKFRPLASKKLCIPGLEYMSFLGSVFQSVM